MTEALRKLWAMQSSDKGRLDIRACPDVKNIGKPHAGIGVGRHFAERRKLAELHVRFDEGGQA